MKGLLIEISFVLLVGLGMYYAARRAGKPGIGYALLGMGTYLGCYFGYDFVLKELIRRKQWEFSPDMEGFLEAAGMIFRILVTLIVYVVVSRNWKRPEEKPAEPETMDESDLLDR